MKYYFRSLYTGYEYSAEFDTAEDLIWHIEKFFVSYPDAGVEDIEAIYGTKVDFTPIDRVRSVEVIPRY